MYLGLCPGNFGQISYYDKAKNEAYRDFADNVGITSRAIINGLFGILPDALEGKCILKPAFHDAWGEASIKTPYLSYSFRREGNKDIYEVEQHFPQPLQIVVRANAGGGAYLEVEGSSEAVQTIVVDRTRLPQAPEYKSVPLSRENAADPAYMTAMGLDDISPDAMDHASMPDISAAFNANVDDISATSTSPRVRPSPPWRSPSRASATGARLSSSPRSRMTVCAPAFPGACSTPAWECASVRRPKAGTSPTPRSGTIIPMRWNSRWKAGPGAPIC